MLSEKCELILACSTGLVSSLLNVTSSLFTNRCSCNASIMVTLKIIFVLICAPVLYTQLDGDDFQYVHDGFSTRLDGCIASTVAYALLVLFFA